MKRENLKIFLAAGSAEGFVSHFPNCYDVEAGYKTYIIKGGPGTGKSTFMKRVLKLATERKLLCTEVYCASDPLSLDGLLIPEIKTVFMDGTAPHVVEPQFVGVCETLLDFGRFWDGEKLRKRSDEIIAATKENKDCHSRAAKLIKKAGRLFPEDFSREGAGAELVSKHIPERGGKGRMTRAFLGGITPSGLKYFDGPTSSTAVTLDGRDADGILKSLVLAAEGRGFDGFVFENPILPYLTDGLYVPELNLFVRKKSFIPKDERIDLLLECAAEEIAKAKEIHDRLEAFYIKAMNFESLSDFCDEEIGKIFG